MTNVPPRKGEAMRRYRWVWIAVALCLVFQVKAQRCEAQSDALLPAGVRAVWDSARAYRETTATRERVCLNGLWRWQPVEAKTDSIPGGNWGYFKVPGPWPRTGSAWLRHESQRHYPHPSWKDKDVNTFDMAWYQREFTVPNDWRGRRITVQTEYLNSYADVYVDGRKAGAISFPGGEADITAACRPGAKHVLSLYVVAMPLRAEIVSYAAADWSTRRRATVVHRGLCGDIFLVGTPPQARVSDVKVDASVRKWEIGLDAALEELEPGKAYVLSAEVLDNGRTVKSIKSEPFRASDLKNGRVAFASPWQPEKLWDTHTPENTYDLEVSLLDSAGKALDAFWPVRFGFRELWIDGRDFRLNGTRIYCFALYLTNARIGPAWASYEGARETMRRLKSVGVNLVYMYNYSCVPGVHVGFDEIFRAADDVGMLVVIALPHWNSYDWTDESADDTNGFAEHTEFYVRQGQNHPSVVMYTMSHNTMGYSDDQNPDRMDGIYTLWPDPEGKVGVRVDERGRMGYRLEAIVDRFDTTRPLYHHAGANMSQMYTLNCYLNFVPIQERSDWLEHWAGEGIKPVFLVEYGAPTPFTWTLHRGDWKGQRSYTNGKLGHQFCTAEWNSQFLGDRAYQLTDEEKANLRFEAAQWRAGNTWYRWDYPFTISDAPRLIPNLSEVLAMYLADNCRAYRTWGLSAISIWSFSESWEPRPAVRGTRKTFPVDWDNLQTPGFSPDFIQTWPDCLDTAYEMSDWIPNSAGEALVRNNRPLLAYLGGKPARFTSKDHNFHAGETLEKQIIVINNSRSPVTCDCSWSADLAGIVSGSTKATVESGQQARIPVRIALPATLKPGDYTLAMTTRFGTGETQEDSFKFHVLPQAETPRLAGKMAVYDPKGETAKLLAGLGVGFDRTEADADLAPYDVLIIGKEALTLSGPAPDLGRVREGLRVLVFEQTSQVLEKRLGFRVQEYGLRRVFPRIADHPVLAGLDAENLRDWRGQATIVPSRIEAGQGKWDYPSTEWCGFKASRAWRRGCTGNVASVLVEKPARGDFLPIVDGGFALQYSPLMEYREGKGMVLLCQMDVTGRTESDPAAMLLVRNMLKRVDTCAPAAPREALYVGAPAGKAHLEGAGMSLGSYEGGRPAADQVLIVGPGGGQKLAAHAGGIGAWLGAGGDLLAIGLSEREANAFLPFKVRMQSAEHIGASFGPPRFDSPLSGIGPADVHNRDPRELQLVSGGASAIGNGILATVPGADVVFCQIVPWDFDYEKFYNQKITYRHASFLVGRLLANMGAAGATPLLSRFSSPVAGPEAPADIVDALWLESDGKECTLPIQWKGLALRQGKTTPPGWLDADFDDADWRTVRVPGTWADQFADLAAFNGEFLYRVRFNLPADMARGGATLVLGAIDDEDWTYINGQQVGSVTQKTNPANYWEAPRRYSIPKGVLRAGENVLAVKVNDLRQAGGILGFPTPTAQQRERVAGLGDRWLEGLYLDRPEAMDDPYRYFRW